MISQHALEVVLTSMRRGDVASTSVQRHFGVMCSLGNCLGCTNI